ncbi:hypothetical protein REPUB_Repub05bG0025500 [Reevesia pubescens]
MELTMIIVTIALTFAMTIALSMKSIGVVAEDQMPPLINPFDSSTTFPNADQPLTLPSKRVSRFLQQEARNPRAADHCHKDEEVCYLQGGYNPTCCNNKCVDLATDDKNCGACKRKCKFTQVCCRGECVNISFDKRHCGACNHRCNPGEYCVYGMCNYA